MIAAMTSPIDPIRRSAPVRRARATVVSRVDRATTDEIPAATAEAAATPPDDPSADAAFAAHLMGQERRRGVRAGVAVPDAAKSAYTRTEWSGAADRRAPPGQLTRKKI